MTRRCRRLSECEFGSAKFALILCVCAGSLRCAIQQYGKALQVISWLAHLFGLLCKLILLCAGSCLISPPDFLACLQI